MEIKKIMGFKIRNLQNEQQDDSEGIRSSLFRVRKKKGPRARQRKTKKAQIKLGREGCCALWRCRAWISASLTSPGAGIRVGWGHRSGAAEADGMRVRRRRSVPPEKTKWDLERGRFIWGESVNGSEPPNLCLKGLQPINRKLVPRQKIIEVVSTSRTREDLEIT